ncbi:hypothetical protein BH23PAT2_BH23PAT2_09340 [soil metagenome]
MEEIRFFAKEHLLQPAAPPGSPKLMPFISNLSSLAGTFVFLLFEEKQKDRPEGVVLVRQIGGMNRQSLFWCRLRDFCILLLLLAKV